MTNGERDPYLDLADALDLVFSGLALCEKALLMNPVKEEQRRLSRFQLRLELERADIVASMNAIIQEDPYPPPTAAQVAEIARLSSEVEKLTNATISVSIGLDLAGDILALASSLADTSPA